MPYIYEEYDLSLFTQRFENMGRLNHFGYDGLSALFDYLEEYAESTGEPFKMDVIGLCCDFSRYENLKEFQDDYGDEYESLEDVRDQTTVILIDDEDGPFIIQSF